MKVGYKSSENVVILVSESKVEKSENIDDADSIRRNEDEDLPNPDSTDGKNMRLCITVQPDKQTYDILPV